MNTTMWYYNKKTNTLHLSALFIHLTTIIWRCMPALNLLKNMNCCTQSSHLSRRVSLICCFRVCQRKRILHTRWEDSTWVPKEFTAAKKFILHCSVVVLHTRFLEDVHQTRKNVALSWLMNLILNLYSQMFWMVLKLKRYWEHSHWLCNFHLSLFMTRRSPRSSFGQTLGWWRKEERNPL